jgi:hypothetical protein
MKAPSFGGERRTRRSESFDMMITVWRDVMTEMMALILKMREKILGGDGKQSLLP